MTRLLTLLLTAALLASCEKPKWSEPPVVLCKHSDVGMYGIASYYVKKSQRHAYTDTVVVLVYSQQITPIDYQQLQAPLCEK